MPRGGSAWLAYQARLDVPLCVCSLLAPWPSGAGCMHGGLHMSSSAGLRLGSLDPASQVAHCVGLGGMVE